MKPFASVDETKRKETFAAWRGKPAAAITTKRDEVERAMTTAFDQAGDDLDLAKVTAIGDGKSLAEKCEALIGVHSELSGLEDALTERTDLDRVAQDIRAGNRGGGVGAPDPAPVQLVRPAPRARLSDLIRADFKAHDGIPALGSAAFASEIARLPLTTVYPYGPYRDPAQEAQRVGGVDMQSPVAGTDYVANTAADGSGTDVTDSLIVAAVFGAGGVQWTIENPTTETVYLTKLQAPLREASSVTAAVRVRSVPCTASR